MGSDSEPKLRKRRALRRRDAYKLQEEAGALLENLESNRVDKALIEDGTEVYLVNSTVQLASRDETLFPTLINPNVGRLPSIVVDMGAIPYVCNGADVMAPGLKEIRGEFEEGDLVVVRDIEHGKALAIGKALVGSDEMKEMRKGKAVMNLHHVGDKLWKALG
ncbi:MAG: hypothetical protein NWF12_00685 [Candidatus Bathyarchaeota archaeon]|jgi:PUA-domain protein|nr:hypothetical protein [Candidatus Bathyarchaeota archaeon]